MRAAETRMGLSKDVCLSVRLFVIRRYSVETAKHISRLFSLSSSHTMPVFFRTKRHRNILTGPPNTGVECKGDMKKSRLSTNILLCLKSDKDMAIITIE